MVDCPACHTPNRDGARFCSSCQHALPVSVGTMAVCPACGKPHFADQPCPHCVQSRAAAPASPRRTRPWWQWSLLIVLVGGILAWAMLLGVLAPIEGLHAPQPVPASAPAMITLQPGMRSLTDQVAATSPAAPASAPLAMVSPAAAPAAMPVPPTSAPAKEEAGEGVAAESVKKAVVPRVAPAPVADAVPEDTTPPTVTPAATPATPKPVARLSKQHEDILRKKEELKRQLGLE